jgi:hypothetical protein
MMLPDRQSKAMVNHFSVTVTVNPSSVIYSARDLVVAVKL